MIKGVGLRKIFDSGFLRRRRVVAVDNVDIEIQERETLALVGESGSGKSTLGRLLLMLIRPTKGEVYFDGLNITKMKEKELRKIRRKMQLIPQHPESALDPRWKIYDSIAEPLRIHKLVDRREEKDVVYELVEMVGLKEEHLERYPHELSGGELQRAVIARAIALKPKFIVCDEPTSMLDVSVQASIVHLLMNLKRQFGLSYLFITHDLELADAIADRVAVMYRGQIVEEGNGVLKDPIHPYTKMLAGFYTVQQRNEKDGCKFCCKFYWTCPVRTERCLTQPKLIDIGGRRVRCWNV